MDFLVESLKNALKRRVPKSAKKRQKSCSCLYHCGISNYFLTIRIDLLVESLQKSFFSVLPDSGSCGQTNAQWIVIFSKILPHKKKKRKKNFFTSFFLSLYGNNTVDACLLYIQFMQHIRQIRISFFS